MVEGTGAVRVSAAQSATAQRRSAAALRAAGVATGERIAVVAHSSPDYLAVVLGALRVGIVPVLVSPLLLSHEQAALVADAEVSAVLGDADLARLVAGDAEVELAPWPLARPMLYTSGTTGTPKGVWSGILDEAGAEALLREERELWGFDADDVHVVASPLHHSAPIRFATGTLLAGGDVVLPGAFDAAQFSATVDVHHPTSTFVVPTHLQRLASLPRTPPLASFRLIAHAGAPCPARLKRWLVDAAPRGSVWEFYGSTEGQFSACSSAEWEARPGTVGRARPGRELSVADDDVIWCRTPPHARFEYWRDAEKTAAAWDGDRFTVGDLGRLDEDGYLFLDGRRDDLVISGGVNVSPLEVERTLLDHPAVREVAVFGAPDDRWGERVCAVVVGTVSPAEVTDWARSRLAPHKRPKQVLVADTIPVNSMGKVRRSELARAFGLEPS